MDEPGEPAGDASSDDANLPALVTRLGEQILSFVDSKVSLLKIEIQEGVGAYGRNLIALGAAGLVGAVGFALINVAVALVVGDLLRGADLHQMIQKAAGFAVTGFVYLVAGSAIAFRAWHRLARPVPRPTGR